MSQELMFFETEESRKQVLSNDAPKYDTQWTAVGFDSDDDVRDVIGTDVIPDTINGLIYQDAEVNPRSGCPGTWDITIHYMRKQPGTPGTMTVEVDIAGEQAKMTHSYGSTYFPAYISQHYYDETTGDDGETTTSEGDELVPQGELDFKNAILLRERGGKIEPEGIDEVFPCMSLVITRYFGTDTDGTQFPMPDEFIQTMLDKAWHVNTDDIDLVIQDRHFDFDGGELLFEGASLKLGSDDHVAVAMKFKFSPNKTGLIMGGVKYDKKGWYFAWPFCEETDVEVSTKDDAGDPTTIKMVMPRVRQVCVEKVKHETTLSELFV